MAMRGRSLSFSVSYSLRTASSRSCTHGGTATSAPACTQTRAPRHCAPLSARGSARPASSSASARPPAAQHGARLNDRQPACVGSAFTAPHLELLRELLELLGELASHLGLVLLQRSAGHSADTRAHAEQGAGGHQQQRRLTFPSLPPPSISPLASRWCALREVALADRTSPYLHRQATRA
jgi:hypothetical protein